MLKVFRKLDMQNNASQLSKEKCDCRRQMSTEDGRKYCLYLKNDNLLK